MAPPYTRHEVVVWQVTVPTGHPPRATSDHVAPALVVRSSTLVESFDATPSDRHVAGVGHETLTYAATVWSGVRAVHVRPVVELVRIEPVEPRLGDEVSPAATQRWSEAHVTSKT